VCYATAMASGVMIDPATRQPIPVPEDFRQLFLQHA
jgi:acyl-CoA thioesterase FadM